MKRETKYPETSTFHYHNQNPKNRITGDCVVRAISLACEKPYNEVVMDLARIQCETGYDATVNQGINILLKKYGWTKMKQPRKIDNTKYSGKEFCEWLNKNDKCNSSIISNIGTHHIVCLKKTDKWKIWDIWNSTNGCVGNYWTKGENK